MVCVGCSLQASAEGDGEFHEFISIADHCGYDSIHGDGKQIDIDLCQKCFADMCGDTLKVTDESNTSAQSNESRDLRLAARELLSRITITVIIDKKHNLFIIKD